MENRFDVVILGAGYAGLSAYLEMARGETMPAGVGVALVDAAPVHTFTTELHGFAAGDEDEEDVTVPLARVIQPPHRLIVDRVQRIDRQACRVVCAHHSIRYTYCVVALGSVPEYFGLQGVAERSFTIHDLEGARRLRVRLEHLTGPAGARRGRNGRPRLVVAGGGLTGVELAAEAAERFGERLSVTLVEAADDILPGLPDRIRRTARRALAQLGVEVVTGSPVRACEENRLVLADRSLPFDCLAWAAGVRGNPVLADSGLAVNRRGRGLVDAFLHAAGEEGLYLAGDCAAALHPETGAELPPTAQVAVQAGRHVGRAIATRLAGGVEKPFAPRLRGLFASLGRRRGVGQVGTVPVGGWAAAALKRAVELEHAFAVGGLHLLLRRLWHSVEPESRRAAGQRGGLR
ncbi:MAG: NAD(P)/FAD-dependent oxidoreductase [Clostridia bacterium]|nr:NAD(P)/FAD-dependent oxidoreductase [Clostridia bacterium]